MELSRNSQSWDPTTAPAMRQTTNIVVATLQPVDLSIVRRTLEAVCGGQNGSPIFGSISVVNVDRGTEVYAVHDALTGALLCVVAASLTDVRVTCEWSSLWPPRSGANFCSTPWANIVARGIASVLGSALNEDFTENVLTVGTEPAL